MRESFVLLSEKPWHETLFCRLQKEFSLYNWIWIQSKSDFKLDRLNDIKPSKIFIPHWSHIIPEDIFSIHECVVFHMTDLPYGRGGSPLQNLITRGFKNTKLSALKVEKGIDTGDIYIKKDLALEGSAEDIFERANELIYDCILEILVSHLDPVPQVGKIVSFKRRTPEMSNIKDLDNIELLYDYIRMLDADGYPHAFFENDFFRFEFRNSHINNGEVLANVRITKK